MLSWEAERLRTFLARSGLTQNELADRAGIDRPRVNAILNGRVTLSPYYAEKLAPVP